MMKRKCGSYYPEMNGKETDPSHSENKDPTEMESSRQSQMHLSDSGYESSIDETVIQDFKFYFIKTTEKTKSGYPILPPDANPSLNKGKINSDTSKTINCIPLRILKDNAESVLSPGIRAFLKRCYDYADKRRRSSRVCKHKPGVKHYCRRKNWDIILSKYKSEILENPLVNLDCFYKGKSLSSNKYLTHYKQNFRQNNTEPEDSFVLTSQKEIPQQESGSSCKRIHHNKLCESDTTSQDGSWTSDSNSECQGGTNCNEMNEMSLFLAIFGLRKVSQKETVNYDNLKLVTDEISNNEDRDASVSLNNISGGIDTKSSNVDVIQETINMEICTDMDCVSDKVQESCENSLDGNKEDLESQVLNSEKIEHCEPENESKEVPFEQISEDSNIDISQSRTIDINNENPISDTSVATNSAVHECTCHTENVSCHINSVNEACVSVQSTANMNNFLVENLLRNGSWSISTCPQSQPSPRTCETKDLITNNHEHEPISSGNRMIPNFQVPFSAPQASQTCTPRQMYATGGVNGVFPNLYGSPCIPTPILASQIVSPILAYNILPMNNIMCTSHPGIMPLPSNGAYLSTAYDCTSQHSVHHSLPLSYHSGQSSHSTLYHKPGFHQWVNVNASTVVPCWTQSTYIGGSHLPCCGGSQAVEARSHLHYSSGFYPTDSYNGLLSYPFNSDSHVASDLISVHGRKIDDVK